MGGYTGTRTLSLTDCWKERQDLAQSKFRHVVVNGLVVASGNTVGFVPDPDVAVASNLAIEFAPSGQMDSIFVSRVDHQVFERTPVLNHECRGKVQRYFGA